MTFWYKRCIISKLALTGSTKRVTQMEKSRSWPSAHDWKSCIPQKGIEGSNPSFSAKPKTPGVSKGFGFFFALFSPLVNALMHRKKRYCGRGTARNNVFGFCKGVIPPSRWHPAHRTGAPCSRTPSGRCRRPRQPWDQWEALPAPAGPVFRQPGPGGFLQRH